MPACWCNRCSGLPHWAGVLIVGAVVIFIVVTAGMVSTTWVQFLKGSLLVGFQRCADGDDSRTWI